MNSILRKVSTITDKGQTTIPKSIRDALGVGYGGRIAFSLDAQNRVYVERDDADGEDPVLDRFLDLLARHMAARPGHAFAEIPPALRARMAALTAGVEVDPDAPIEGEVEL
ncbi:AbrB family transcriptional regulator [Rhizobium sp. Root274]|uniref:type II toxin-antitoxin system PrlF family antitoxin n=1 Tax=unclassified Rhizobium TaxID=2613769 RepID=UPI000714B812|nr:MULTISPECIES: type II toxin-antitoxin system PrlF family antitoxin [unclassified Rhizobium]KQW31127.1 AbrB family transcriptional regulator [Rhizobium sp. Root1240]KRD32674.1 AbrB family transcriptional regulator [Rhizobium sp. Root274]